MDLSRAMTHPLHSFPCLLIEYLWASTVCQGDNETSLLPSGNTQSFREEGVWSSLRCERCTERGVGSTTTCLSQQVSTVRRGHWRRGPGLQAASEGWLQLQGRQCLAQRKASRPLAGPCVTSKTQAASCKSINQTPCTYISIHNRHRQ